MKKNEIQEEAIRGRDGMPARRHVVLPVTGGFRVFSASTEKAVSPTYRSRGRALEAFSAVEAGIVLVAS